METLTERVQIEPIKVPKYLPKQMGEDLYNLINNREPLLIDEFEGKIFMRGSCDKRPCKGHYQ